MDQSQTGGGEEMKGELFLYFLILAIGFFPGVIVGAKGLMAIKRQFDIKVSASEDKYYYWLSEAVELKSQCEQLSFENQRLKIVVKR